MSNEILACALMNSIPAIINSEKPDIINCNLFGIKFSINVEEASEGSISSYCFKKYRQAKGSKKTPIITATEDQKVIDFTVV